MDTILSGPTFFSTLLYTTKPHQLYIYIYSGHWQWSCTYPLTAVLDNMRPVKPKIQRNF